MNPELENRSIADINTADPSVAPAGGVLQMLRHTVQISVAVGALLVAYSLGGSGDRPVGQLSASQLNFGDVWCAADFRWKVNLFNSGNEDIRIARFVSGCRCTRVEPESIVVPARGNAAVALILDLRQTGTQDLCELKRPFVISLSGEVAGSSEKVGPWQVEGHVLNSFTSNRPGVFFKGLLLKGKPLLTETIAITPNVEARRIYAQCDSQLATVEINKINTAKNEFEVAVTPGVALPVGRFDFPVSIIVEDDAGRRLPASPLQVKGEIVTDIHAVPADVSFGIVVARQPASQTLTLQSYLGTDFEVASVRADHNGILAKISNPGLAKRHDVAITGIFDDRGSHNSRMTISLKNSDGESVLLSVLVRAYVVDK